MKLWKVLARNSHVYTNQPGMRNPSQMELYDYKSVCSTSISEDSGKHSEGFYSDHQRLQLTTTVQLRKNPDETLGIIIGVIGAIDGTHIFVKVEKEQQDSYIDRYRRHSINLMAVCDSETLFTYTFVGFPGSAHDSRVFENSIFYKNIEKHGSSFYFNDEEYHLIGDSAFALKKWLMTPYRGDNLTTIQKKHNYCLSSERVKIEHAFGAYKGRWGRVRFINTYNIYKAIEIASAACVLHNFCLLNGYFWDENLIWEHNREDENNDRSNTMGKIKRDRIATNLYNSR